jgi:tetratricopeptide (TPR) repeat protein
VAKRIHRKKIYEDQFVQRSSELLQTAVPYVQQHRQNLLYAAAAVAGVLLVATLMFAWRAKSNERAQAQLDEALRAASAQTQPGQPAADPAAAAALARQKLEAFLADHPSGQLAGWAHYHLAGALMEQGDAEGAAAQYGKFLAHGPREGTYLGRMGLANALHAAGKTEEAISEWRRLKELGWGSDRLELEVASAQLHTDRAKALDELRKLADKEDSPVAQQAEALLRLHAPGNETKSELLVQGVPEPPAPEPGTEAPSEPPPGLTAAPEEDSGAESQITQPPAEQPAAIAAEQPDAPSGTEPAPAEQPAAIAAEQPDAPSGTEPAPAEQPAGPLAAEEPATTPGEPDQAGVTAPEGETVGVESPPVSAEPPAESAGVETAPEEPPAAEPEQPAAAATPSGETGASEPHAEPQEAEPAAQEAPAGASPEATEPAAAPTPAADTAPAPEPTADTQAPDEVPQPRPTPAPAAAEEPAGP